MTRTKFPTLSILIINRNGGVKLRRCLQEISLQDYPKNLIETIIIDGSSTDNSSAVARKFGAKFIAGGFPENQEARRFIAVREAKNEIIAWIDTDNYLPTKDWLKRMVTPLILDNEIFASETWHYAYRKSDGGFNRYCSLFGVNDPVAFYLGKADRATYYHRNWQLMGQSEDMGDYYKVKFNKDLPTVGCNGFLIRRSVLNQVLTTPEQYFHIDVIYDLILKGHQHIAFVKNDIIHDTSDRLSNLVRKRTVYFSQHGVKQVAERRYKVFDPGKKRDKRKLLLFIVYTVTIIKPLFDSFRGFIKKPDLAWFLHPIVCWLFLYAYGMVVLKKIITK